MDETQIEMEENILRGRTMPPVKSLRLANGDFVTVADGVKVEVRTSKAAAPGAAELVADLFRSFWKVEADVSVKTAHVADGAEAYAIGVRRRSIAISSAGLAGLRYAVYTLRQLAESERGVAASTRFILPCVDIEDSPAMPFRGMHLCWFPCGETTAVEIERQIRMAAYAKMNYAVVESWGVLRYESHPDFCWDEGAVPADEMRRLVKVAKSVGITLIPQLNIFGHAAQARSVSHKHMLLDMHPEYAPLFEPDGWCWCLSNPHTRKFLDDIVDELFDIFGNPPFFHFGCDEAAGAGTCALCRRTDYNRLLLDHLGHFREKAAAHGARPMIWHDMFIDRGDPKFDGYVRSGDADFVKAAKELPRDFVICDWQYDWNAKAEKDGEIDWATTRAFMDDGFDAVACPWLDTRTMLSLGRFIARNKGFGLLQTTWHRNHAEQSFLQFYYGSTAAWDPFSDAMQKMHASPHTVYATHLRSVLRDMGVRKYKYTGTVREQTTSIITY